MLKKIRNTKLLIDALSNIQSTEDLDGNSAYIQPSTHR